MTRNLTLASSVAESEDDTQGDIYDNMCDPCRRHTTPPLSPRRCQAPPMNTSAAVPRTTSPLYSHLTARTAASPANEARSESTTSNLTSSLTPGSTTRHWSLFYPAGVTAQSPPLLHYLVLRGWRTVAGGRDYYSHRRLRQHETRGHTVRWLHNAQPRGSFVFLIDPVEPCVGNSQDSTTSDLRCVDKEDVHAPTTATSAPLLSPPEVRGGAWRRVLRWHPWRPSLATPAFARRRRHRGERPAAECAIEESDDEVLTAMTRTWPSYAARPPRDRSYANSAIRHACCSPAGCAQVLRPVVLADTPLGSALRSDTDDVSTRPHLSGGRRDGARAAQGRRCGGAGHGAEAVVILHADTTALDYLPGLVSSRLSIEARVVRTYYFPSVEAAMSYYGCGPCECAPCACPSPQPDVSPPRHSDEATTATELFSAGCTPILGPCASSTTATNHVPPQLISQHTDTVLSIYTADPNFNAVLRELLMPEPGTHPYTTSLTSQRRLLSLYETGMPRWASLVAATGMPYRRTLRLCFVLLVNTWPLVSLGVGFYDLYRHLPQLKHFLSRTIDPVARWVDQRVTVRVSMLTTYLVSVALNIFASLGSFLSPFFVLHRVTLPLVQLGYTIVRLPFVLVFETVWSVLSISYAFFSLLFVTARVVLIGPCEILTHLYAMRGVVATTAAEVPMASSVTMQWLGAWQEFWVTVASPVNNVAKAVYNSLQHVALSVVRREESIRRLCGPTLTRTFCLAAFVRELVVVNARICAELFLPGCDRTLALLLVSSYLYWLLVLRNHTTAVTDEADLCVTQAPT